MYHGDFLLISYSFHFVYCLLSCLYHRRSGLVCLSACLLTRDYATTF
jgi:hypothetical protein